MSNANLTTIRQRLREGTIGYISLDNGAGVLIDAKGLHSSSLNETASFIVKQIIETDEDRSTIVNALVDQFDVDIVQAATDFDAFLGALHQFHANGSDVSEE